MGALQGSQALVDGRAGRNRALERHARRRLAASQDAVVSVRSGSVIGGRLVRKAPPSVALPPQRSYARPRGSTRWTTMTLRSMSRVKRTRQSDPQPIFPAPQAADVGSVRIAHQSIKTGAYLATDRRVKSLQIATSPRSDLVAPVVGQPKSVPTASGGTAWPRRYSSRASRAPASSSDVVDSSSGSARASATSIGFSSSASTKDTARAASASESSSARFLSRSLAVTH